MGVEVKCINCIFSRPCSLPPFFYEEGRRVLISKCVGSTSVYDLYYSEWERVCNCYKPNFESIMKEVIKKHEEETNEKK
jgi:hypothetical protein